MLQFENGGVQFQVDLPNRCVFCFAKLIDHFDGTGTVDENVIPKYMRDKRYSRKSEHLKEFPVEEFQQVWRHLTPQAKSRVVFVSGAPPLCGICGMLLEKIPVALKQLFTATTTIKTRIKNLGGKTPDNHEQKMASFWEDLKATVDKNELRRETLYLLEMLGHGPLQNFLEETEVKPAVNDSNLVKVSVESEVENVNKTLSVVKMEENEVDPLLEVSDNHRDMDTEEKNIPIVTQEFLEQDPFFKKAPKVAKKRKPTKFIRTKQTCDFCGDVLPLDDILKHVRSHVGDLALPCQNPSCQCAFSSISKLRIHLQTTPCRSFMTENDTQNLCELCGHNAINLLRLRSHLKIAHETAEKPFPCPVLDCSHRFTYRQTLLCHITSHTVNGKLVPPSFQSCPQCSKRHPQDKIKNHLINKHGADPNSLIFCKHCPNIFPNREKLLDHFQHHIKSGTPVSCDLCEDDKKYLRIGLVRDHYWEAHQVGGDRFVCEHCSKAFSMKSFLQNHLKVVHSGCRIVKATFKCPDCPDQEFKTEKTLMNHKIKYHGADPYKCQYCEKEFKSYETFYDHENEHRGIFRKMIVYTCDIPGCGRKFAKRKALDTHKTSVEHVGETNEFVCNECGKGFNHEASLKNHQKMHVRERSFVCEDCGESFKMAKTLKHHKLIHTGLRPFECEICKQRFRQKEVLKRHVEGHEKKGPNFRPNGPMKKVRKRVNPK